MQLYTDYNCIYIYIYICANHNCIVDLYCIFVLLNANIVDRTQQMEQISMGSGKNVRSERNTLKVEKMQIFTVHLK